jgi:hypothetical protein
MKPHSRFCEPKPERQCFGIESQMQMLKHNVITIICLQQRRLSSEWWKARDPKSWPLMTWPSCVQCYMGSYRITLLGVSRGCPTSQTTSITISNSVVWTMQNTFSSMRQLFWWRLFNPTSKQFVWFIGFGPQGGESLSHEEMIQCFSGWGRVRIATLSRLRDAFPHARSVFSLPRMLNHALNSFLPSLTYLQQGQYIRLLVWWLSRRGISLWGNLWTMEATVVSLFLASEPLISSL